MAKIAVYAALLALVVAFFCFVYWPGWLVLFLAVIVAISISDAIKARRKQGASKD
jgi:hypothetical protein